MPFVARVTGTKALIAVSYVLREFDCSLAC